MGKTRLWGRHVIKGRHTLRRHEGETRWKDSFPWVTCPFLRFASQSTDKMTTIVNVVTCALPLHAVPVAWVLRVHTKELVPASHLRSIISATCLPIWACTGRSSLDFRISSQTGQAAASCTATTRLWFEQQFIHSVNIIEKDSKRDSLITIRTSVHC